MGAASRKDGKNPYKIPRDDLKEELGLLQRWIRKIETEQRLKLDPNFDAEWLEELKGRHADMLAEWAILSEKAREFRIPPPNRCSAPYLPAGWGV